MNTVARPESNPNVDKTLMHRPWNPTSLRARPCAAARLRSETVIERVMVFRLVCAAVVAAALLTVTAGSGSAEPSDGVTRAVKSKTQRSQTAPVAHGRAAQDRAWSIEDALPGRPKTETPADRAQAKPTELGRIPLQSGTVGFSTKSQVNPYETPEGQRLPSLESNARHPPSYLGLSLSLPTSDKAFSVPSLFGSSSQ